jgi:hypothetical protein
MEIIQNYKPESYNLIYLAKPIYGGWVTFTAHLSHKYKYPLFKLSKKNESCTRNFGYNISYQNVTLEKILKMGNLIITALDKHYWDYLQYFPPSTKVIIHDPTELKTSKNNPNPLLTPEKKLLSEFKIITIRESVQRYISENYSIQSEFLVHPFYKYPLDKTKDSVDYRCISISRIDFDKHTDIILKANKLINKEKDKIRIFGAENRLYVFHKLQDLDFHTWWMGKFPKTLPLITEDNKSILNNCQFVIDMSLIKNDGGGTQYTFLEAIYEDCILILHNEWIQQGTLFKSGVNCIGVSNEHELANVINETTSYNYDNILQNSKQLLQKHCEVKW